MNKNSTDDLIEHYSFYDINWYFIDTFNRICVVASGGGILPQYIINHIDKNDAIHKMVLELNENYDIGRNELINIKSIQLEVKNVLDNYFSEFEKLARKGLYVYDRFNINDPEDQYYWLVAYPIYDTTRDKYPLTSEELKLFPRIGNNIINRNNNSFSQKNFEKINFMSFIFE